MSLVLIALTESVKWFFISSGVVSWLLLIRDHRESRRREKFLAERMRQLQEREEDIFR